jgi:glutamine cyclotransferase
MELLIERKLPAPGYHLCGMAWDGSNLWHSDGETSLLYKLDPTTGKILAKIPCRDVRTDLGYDGKSLWQIAGRPKRIVVIDPARGEVLRELDLGPHRENACGLCVSGTNYWAGFKERGVIEERSIQDQETLREYRTLGRADGLALVDKNIWYTDYDRSLLLGIDLASAEEVERYRVPGKPTGLCWDGSRFWYSDYANRLIVAARLK